MTDPWSLEEQAANLISDAISPRLLPDVELLSYRDTCVLAVQVFPSPNRPHHLGPDAAMGTYVRVGSTNRRADADLSAEMRRFARHESFDERPMPDLDSEALDFRAASESFAEFRQLAQPDLDILGLLTTHQGRKVGRVGAACPGRDRPPTARDDSHRAPRRNSRRCHRSGDSRPNGRWPGPQHQRARPGHWALAARHPKSAGEAGRAGPGSGNR